MLTYPEIDPVALSLGPLRIHWYGLMYLIGFAGGWWLGRVRANRPQSSWTPSQVDDLLFYVVMGVVLGGRIGYMLFYAFPQFINQPLMLLRIWDGGMSFHGGLLGVLTAAWLYGRKYRKGFFGVTDFLAPLVPIGLGAGRIGNFINGELWGKFTDLPWGMGLPCRWYPDYCAGLPPGAAYSPPVHPSQLYEAVVEGLVLFVILWLYSARPRPTMAVSGIFLLCYGIFRFAVELVRLPDAHLGYLALGWVTMGQLLTLPMLVGGLLLLWMSRRSRTAGQ
jgi:phosphatidylglycerol:prolipoprotein diacylglycerol transferase